MGDRQVTTQNLSVVSTDPDRGLIMIRGAVPGSKGGWVFVRDAIKRSLPDGVPFPGAFKAPAGSEKPAEAAAEAQAESEAPQEAPADDGSDAPASEE